MCVCVCTCVRVYVCTCVYVCLHACVYAVSVVQSYVATYHIDELVQPILTIITKYWYRILFELILNK